MNSFNEEIKKIQSEDCGIALEQVIERYTPVFLSMYSKYSASITKSGADPNDVLSDKGLIIYESAKSFDLNKGSSFCTWLSNNVKYRCLHMMNKSTKITLLEEKVRRNTSVDADSKNPYKNRELNSFIFNELSKIKDSRVKKVYSLRYFSGGKMTWAKIGKALGFSSQTAINLHKKGAEILKRKITHK